MKTDDLELMCESNRMSSYEPCGSSDISGTKLRFLTNNGSCYTFQTEREAC